jgi:hypothetical protein
MMAIVEQLVEWRLAGETEVLRENLQQCHSVHHKSHMTWPGSNPVRRGGKPVTNRLSYGMAQAYINKSIQWSIFTNQLTCFLIERFKLFVKSHQRGWSRQKIRSKFWSSHDFNNGDYCLLGCDFYQTAWRLIHEDGNLQKLQNQIRQNILLAYMSGYMIRCYIW